MLFVLDNYDSFTYNLVQYLGELGASMKVARNDKITVDEVERLELEGIVISPGPGTPEDGGISLDLVRGFPAELEISARAEDGEIMGLRHRRFPVEGVQFHPESILTGQGKALLRNFLELTRTVQAA